jgi:drug/metabolite transporter (DMT)-like permease
MPEQPLRTEKIPVGLVLGTSVVFAGLAYPVTGTALDLTSPSVVAVSRALLGALVMLPVLRRAGARLPQDVRGWAWATVIGAGNVTITLIAISEGTRLAGAAAAAVLLNSAPFFVAVLARLVLDERLTPLRVAGLVVGFGGIVMVVAGEPSGSGGSRVAEGVIVCLVGSLAWAASGLGMRYLSVRDRSFDVLGTTTAQFLCGGVMLLPYLAVNGTGDTDWSSAELWLALAFLVVAAQVFTYMGFYVALARWTSARVFSWTFLVPAVAVVVEAVQGELPSAVTCIGMVVVIAGVAAVTHPRAEPRAAVQVQQADG